MTRTALSSRNGPVTKGLVGELMTTACRATRAESALAKKGPLFYQHRVEFAVQGTPDARFVSTDIRALFAAEVEMRKTLSYDPEDGLGLYSDIRLRFGCGRHAVQGAGGTRRGAPW